MATFTVTLTPVPVATPTPLASEIIFDSDNASNWYPSTTVNINLNSSALNHTVGGSEAGSAPWSSGGHLDLHTLYPRAWSDFDFVEFWIYPLGANLSLAHFLADPAGPTTGIVTIDAAYGGGWRLNEWNRVVVPFTGYASALANLDAFHLYTTSVGGYADFYLDDVRLGKGPLPTALPTPATTVAIATGNGTLSIDQAVAWPNPGAKALQLHLQGNADSIEAKIYTPGMTVIGQVQSGPRAAGWSSLVLPPDWSGAQANGLYYIKLTAKRGGVSSKTVTLKAYAIR